MNIGQYSCIVAPPGRLHRAGDTPVTAATAIAAFHLISYLLSSQLLQVLMAVAVICYLVAGCLHPAQFLLEGIDAVSYYKEGAPSIILFHTVHNPVSHRGHTVRRQR